ncbi:SepM family pheromone-processing serine protease [Sporosarcina ureilytica]|uniref:Peptidase n=1 Tax=Sporosarcina ureilytica TaxID=298596 RepID=A0A1D8JI53_9BACL|nr:SepM family pheromone-processing serine protease [Sporosarcina ureilytica]AOV08363.1 peptidase [Sporosarcina ureilytica]
MRMKRIGIATIILVVLAGLFFYPMDSYITQPGGAYDLAPLVEVVGGDEEDMGTFSLMTISLSKTTPVTYALSRFSDKRKLLQAENVRRHGENEAEYNLRQKRLMSDSQFNAITVAFGKAGIPVDIELNGVFVMQVLPKGASSNILEIGDIIHEIDGIKLSTSGEFVEHISEKQLGDEVQLTVERNEEMLDVVVALQEIPNGDGRVGLGIQFQEDRIVTTKPEVTIHTSNIGGPSAGLMFTLEILNRLLVDEDITKGYHIAGTGEMLEDGSVGRIGGADFKVMAADKDGIEIFFAPDDEIPEEVRQLNPGIQSNYEEALQTAKAIRTKMKIVPVKTIDDALNYLNDLQPKSSDL